MLTVLLKEACNSLSICCTIQFYRDSNFVLSFQPIALELCSQDYRAVHNERKVRISVMYMVIEL